MATNTFNNLILTIGDSDFQINTSPKSSASIKATLTKISFNKGLYRPGEMHATLTVPSSYTYADIKDTFFEEKGTGNRKKVTLRYGLMNGTTVEKKEIIAENYYVFSMKPIFRKSSNQTTHTVELTIFSDDKLMTLDKFSHAYTARKLGSCIFKDGVDRFYFTQKTITKNDKGEEVTKSTAIPLNTNADTVANDLKIISYEETENVSDPNPKTTPQTTPKNELIQPYLVQYNESFYDFLKRTANRCGEFLYHEDGKLHLGVTINDKTETDYASIASEYYYQDIHPGDVGVENFAFNYIEDEDDNNTDTPELPYDDPLATDDYLSYIGKEYTSYSKQMYKHEKNAVSYVCAALQCASLGEIAGALSFQAVFQSIDARVVTKTQNDTHYKCNIKNWDEDSKNEMWKTGARDDDDKLRQYATGKDQESIISDKKINLYAKFYNLVREKQKEVGKNAVFLDFKDNPQSLKIGDKIKVDGMVFVVIEVRGSQEYVDGKYELHQTVVGIRPYNMGDSTHPNYIPIPPRLNNLIIRESQAQPATVAFFFDPKKIGRVRIKFAWQQSDGDASPWIRVALPFATDGGGVKFRPEIGDEVMVSFIDGNVERPYVSGYLLSEKSNKAWNALPDRSITSKNGHNITFNDGVDGTNFFLNMLPVAGVIKSFIPNSVVDKKFNTDGGLALTGGTSISDRYGLYQIKMSTDNRSIMIKSAMGNVTINAFTGINITAPNGNINISGKNVNISASNNVNITSGKALQKRFFPDSGLSDDAFLPKKIGFSAARSVAELVVGGVDSAVQKTIDKFLDLTLIRTLLEVFMRPIEGTTRIKSFTFVQVEAGKGSTEYPEEAFPKPKEGKKIEEKAFFPYLSNTINIIVRYINVVIKDYKTQYEATMKALNEFRQISNNDQNAPNKDYCVINLGTIKDAVLSHNKTAFSEDDFNWPENLKPIEEEKDLKEQAKQFMLKSTNNGCDHKPDDKDARYKNENGSINYNLFNQDKLLWDTIWNSLLKKNENVSNRILKREKIVSTASNLALALSNLKKTNDKDSIKISHPLVFQEEANKAISDTRPEDFIKPDDIEIDDVLPGDFDKSIDTLTTKWRRKAIYKMLELVKNNAENIYPLDVTYDSDKKVEEDTNWKELIDSWKPIIKNPPSEPKEFLSNMWSYTSKKVSGDWKQWADNTYKNPWKDAIVNHRRWATGLKGKILLSDQADKTMIIDANGVVAKPNSTSSEPYIENIKNRLKSI